MFEKEAEEYRKDLKSKFFLSEPQLDLACQGFKDGFNKANEQLTLPKDILGLWEQTVCEIRSEIKSWDLKGPHVSDYAKELCDKLEHSMCAVAGGPYSLRYSITD